MEGCLGDRFGGGGTAIGLVDVRDLCRILTGCQRDV